MIGRGLTRLVGAAKRSIRPVTRLSLAVTAGPRLQRCFEPGVVQEGFEPQIGVTKAYGRITNEKIEEFLERHRIKYKVRTNGQVVVRECPFCPKPHKDQMSNLWTLNFKENAGAFLCFRCGNHGSWYDFVRFVLGDTINFEKNSPATETRDPEVELRLKTERTAKVVEECEAMYQQLLETIVQLDSLEKNPQLQLTDPTAVAHMSILQYLIGTDTKDQRHLSLDTLRAYKLGIGEEMFKNEEGENIRVPVVCYPLFRPTVKKGKAEKDLNTIDNLNYDCVRAKLRGVGKAFKHYQRFKPVGGHVGVFGLNTLTEDSKVQPSDSGRRHYRGRVRRDGCLRSHRLASHLSAKRCFQFADPSDLVHRESRASLLVDGQRRSGTAKHRVVRQQARREEDLHRADRP